MSLQIFPGVCSEEGIFGDIISVIFQSWVKTVIPTFNMIRDEETSFFSTGFLICDSNVHKPHHRIQIFELFNTSEKLKK